MKRTLIAALALMALPAAALAQEQTFYGADGRVVGRSTTDSAGSTTFYDASGRVTGSEAGMEHYIKAGRMLNEVRDSDQVPYGSWGRWLKDNFHISRITANDYMRIARKVEEDPSCKASLTTIDEAIGREPRTIKSVTKKNKLKSLFDGVDKVNVTRLAEERQTP